MHRYLTVLLVALFSVGLNRTAAQVLRPHPVSPDAPLRGALTNGVSYVVLPHPSTRGELSVRLAVRVGMLDESDEERGFAHLVHHLGRDSVARFAPPKFRAYSQRFTPDFPHEEASYTHSTYSIDLTIGGVEQVDEVLAALSQVAGGLTFPAAEVARILPGVAQEIQPATDPSSQLFRQINATLYGETNLPGSDAQAGTELLRRVTGERLEAFYRRNYLPDRMTVVVVGRVEPHSVAEKIANHFGLLAASGAPSSPVRGNKLPPMLGIRPSVFSFPGAPVDYASIEITSIQPRPDDTPAGRRLEFIQSVAISAFKARLDLARRAERFPASQLPSSEEIAEAIADHARSTFPDPQTQIVIAPAGQSTNTALQAELSRQSMSSALPPQPVVIYRAPGPAAFGLVDTGGTTQVGRSIAPGAKWLRSSVRLSAVSGGWDWLLKVAEAELRRVRTEGFSTDDIAEAVSRQMIVESDRVSQMPELSSERLADDIAQVSGEGRIWQSPGERLAEARSAHANKSEIEAALAALFPAEAFHLILVAGGARRFEPDRLLALHSKYAKAPLRRREFNAPPKLEFRTSPPVLPVLKTHLSDLDLTLASFANGVKANFRPGNFDGNRFRLCLVFSRYWTETSPKAAGLAQAAGVALLNGPFRQRGSLQEFFASHDVRANFIFEWGVPVLEIDAPAEALEFVLQVLHLRFSRVSWEPGTWSKVTAKHIADEKQKAIDPELLTFQSALQHFTGGDKRIGLLPSAHSTPVPLEGEIASAAKKYFLDGPMEIGVVGNFSADRVLGAVAASLGALHTRAAPPKPGAPLKMNQRASRQDHFAPFPGNLGIACAQWPVALTSTPREDAAVTLAGDILRERLTSVLRDGFGAANTAAVRLHHSPTQRDLAFVEMLMFFPPASLRQFTGGVLQMAARLAEKGVTAEELSAARQAVIARTDQEMKNDGWWLREVVALAQTYPGVLAVARDRRADLESLTLEEVNAAARIFSSERATVVELRPQPPQRSDSKPPVK